MAENEDGQEKKHEATGQKLDEAADEGLEVSMFELEVDVSQFSSEVAFFNTTLVRVSSEDVKIPSSAS